ncbi:hypothetical protein QJS10_CPB17g01055 [Acorus calamus]|uniref:Beta-carotene isomerase D27-like C-terminal domain-containing protein n=1 Tax=Acorus calamus TaxID=4465 RepID=A0AAV9CYY3_ACOCL|nr:hypothetical protein QJS10_CPB17g01055 [Acorus calamus]
MHATGNSRIEEGKLEYKPGMFDRLFLSFFRHKMVEEVGWDLEKAGYHGLIEVVNRLMMKGWTNLETEEAAVLVQKCKYLEESKCVGICINTCKLPTQTFFKEHMGVPLLMEPNFTDYSCQFKFGISPPPSADDKALHEPCLEICPNVACRRGLSGKNNVDQCPKV